MTLHHMRGSGNESDVVLNSSTVIHHPLVPKPDPPPLPPKKILPIGLMLQLVERLCQMTAWLLVVQEFFLEPLRMK